MEKLLLKKLSVVGSNCEAIYEGHINDRPFMITQEKEHFSVLHNGLDEETVSRISIMYIGEQYEFIK